MSLLRSEEHEETISFICVPAEANRLASSALRDFLEESFDRFQLAGLALICLKNEASV